MMKIGMNDNRLALSLLLCSVFTSVFWGKFRFCLFFFFKKHIYQEQCWGEEEMVGTTAAPLTRAQKKRSMKK